MKGDLGDIYRVFFQFHLKSIVKESPKNLQLANRLIRQGMFKEVEGLEEVSAKIEAALRPRFIGKKGVFQTRFSFQLRREMCIASQTCVAKVQIILALFSLAMGLYFQLICHMSSQMRCQEMRATLLLGVGGSYIFLPIFKAVKKSAKRF